MKLRDFIKILEDEKFKIHKNQYFVDISWKGGPCARVSLTIFADCWINNSQIKDREVCVVLNRTVSAFANTPLNDRNEKIIAAHKNGSYVRDISRKKVDEPEFVIEMTDKLDEADEHINVNG